MGTMCPGIKVKDFKYINNFAIYIKLYPSSYQLVTDQPIDLNTLQVIPNDQSSLLFNGEPITSNDIIQNANDLQQNVVNQIDNIKQQVDDLLQNIEDSLKNPSNEVDCSSVNPEDLTDESKTQTTTVQVKNSQGEIIKEETISISETPIAKCNIDGLYHAMQSMPLPDNVDPFNQEIDDPYANLCDLPSNDLKSVLNYTKDNMQNDIDNMTNQFNLSDYESKMKDIFKNITGLDSAPTNTDELQDYYNNYVNQDTVSSTEINFKLAIPLVVFDKSKNIILQINDYKIEVINLTDGSNHYLKIDKEIPLNHDVEIVFKTNGFQHDLWMKIEGDNTIYHDQLVVPKSLTIDYIGIDSNASKNFCGLIKDIQIFTGYQADLQTILNNQYQFRIPFGALYYYDWHKDRILKNLVFPLPDLKPPVKMQGDIGTYQLNIRDDTNYWFMHHSFLTEFFCYKNFQPSEWSINFWFYIYDLNDLKDVTGFSSYRVLINDFKNKYQLAYDAVTLTFRITIKDKEYYIPYMLNDKTWYYFILKYKDKKLVLKIKSIDDPDTNTEFFTDEITLDEDISTFMIHSMLAEFNGKYFTNFFVCKFGTLALFDKFNSDDVDYDIYSKEKEIIQFFKL